MVSLSSPGCRRPKLRFPSSRFNAFPTNDGVMKILSHVIDAIRIPMFRKLTSTLLHISWRKRTLKGRDGLKIWLNGKMVGRSWDEVNGQWWGSSAGWEGTTRETKSRCFGNGLHAVRRSVVCASSRSR